MLSGGLFDSGGVEEAVTSLGQKILRKMVRLVSGGAATVDNFRPRWLNGLEIDIWLPDFNLGFEFDGDQHKIPVFGAEAFLSQMERDVIKDELLHERGIVLIRIDASTLDCRSVYKFVTERTNLAENFPLYLHGPDHRLVDEEAEKYRSVLRLKFLSPSAFSDKEDRWRLVSQAHKKLSNKQRRKMSGSFARRKRLSRKIRDSLKTVDEIILQGHTVKI